MASLIIRAEKDGSYNVPVSKDKQKHYRWMPPKPLGTAIRHHLGLRPKALIGYK